MSTNLALTPKQQDLATLALRLKEWDENGEGKFSAVDFAVAARAVVAAFAVKAPSFNPATGQPFKAFPWETQ